MPERRWERRLLCADLVELEWNDSAGRRFSATALLEDISPSGACLQTDIPVPPMASIAVRHGAKTLQGVVRYCQYREIGYFAGVTFHGDQHWSRSIFRPKHLTDPLELKKPAASKLD